MSIRLQSSISRGVIAALAIVGLLMVLIATVDGRIAAWSQHLAQNAADASALAGTHSLLEIAHSAAFDCEQTSDSLILRQIQLYADLNHVPDATTGLNVQAYYLEQTEAGTYRDLLNPETGQRWKVGSPGTVPCNAAQGLYVEVYYPQETLITRLLTIEHARVVVNATATWQPPGWCETFAVYGLSTDNITPGVSITGADLTVAGGGIHSSGALTVHGADGMIVLDADYPVEYATAAEDVLIWEAVEGLTAEGAARIGASQNTNATPDSFYRYEDFQPGGFIWEAALAKGAAFYLPEGLDADAIQANGSGLYVTDGPVTLGALPVSAGGEPWRVTIVTPQHVTISAEMGTELLPFTHGVLLYSTSADDDAVAISQDANNLTGLVIATNGRISVHLTGDATLQGTLLGKTVAISGTQGAIHRQPALCPPSGLEVALLAGPESVIQSAFIASENG